QEFQRAKANVDTAAAALEEARAERLELEVLEQRLMMMAAEKTRVEAQRDRQSLDVADRAIRSPLPGVIDETFIDVGEYVRPGQRLLMIHDPRKVWVIANVKETEIRHVKLGAHVDVTVDAYPGEKFDGKVSRIGNAATSQFALLPNP
ncbi:MAG TPA: HlyD family secretion protein, partial [Alphaproteobacteria bacterium]|nr:HlyD family secretion protein [Alphaproteobacteria bacterium]